MVECGVKVHVVKGGEVWFKSACGEVWSNEVKCGVWF